MRDIFQKFFRRTPKTRMLLFIISDVVLISLAIYLAFLLRFDGVIPAAHFYNLQGGIILAIILCLPVFYFFRLYSFSWVYVSTNELISLFKAITISFSFLGASLLIFRDQPFLEGFPRSTFIISYFLVFIFSGGIRFSKRIYLQIFSRQRTQVNKERTLIIGAGDAGEQILRNIQNSSYSPYLPVGFIDDDVLKQGNLIHGIKVLAGVKDIPEIVNIHRIQRLIVALPSADSSTVKKAVQTGRKAGIKKIKIIPSLSEIINGQVSFPDIREFQIEDLLDREPIVQGLAQIEKFIQDKAILITGAAGSIGSEIARQVAKFSPSLLLLLDKDETGIFNISEEIAEKFPALRVSSLIANIQDKDRIDQTLSKFHPDIILHAAAYKHVPLMEIHPGEAIKNNIFGTKILAEASLKHKIEKFIFISTDKAVNPTSVMGATKRVGEIMCQALSSSMLKPGSAKTKFISVRFGNVLDSRGSVVPIFKEQIKKGGTIQITHPEMKRYFMTIPEAVLLVMQAGVMGQGGEVFVLDMGNPVRILDLAKDLIRLSGLEPDRDIPIVFTRSRPGEKFFEEILTAEEGTIATQDQKIFMAKLPGVNKKRIRENLEKLKKLAYSDSDREKIKTILKELIPSYQPDISQN